MAPGCKFIFSSLQITGSSHPPDWLHGILSQWSVKCFPKTKSFTAGFFCNSFGLAGSNLNSSLEINRKNKIYVPTYIINTFYFYVFFFTLMWEKTRDFNWIFLQGIEKWINIILHSTYRVHWKSLKKHKERFFPTFASLALDCFSFGKTQ